MSIGKGALDSPNSTPGRAAISTSFAEDSHSPSASRGLPEKPLIVIEANRPWSWNYSREVWAYRELLYFLTWRDVKIRYKQTVLGFAWVVIQPLATMLVFSLIFGRLAGLSASTKGIPYPIFAYAGLLPWTFFANAVSQSGNSLVGSAHLITKIYFPRLIVPIASVGALLVDFALGFIFLLVLMLYYGVAPTGRVLLLPLFVLLATQLALAVGTLLSALNVRYRDVRHLLPFLVQIWMFASPVIYPTTLVPGRWRRLLALNPMTGIIEGFRACLFPNMRFDLVTLAISLGVTLGLFVYSLFAFRRMVKGFADVI